MRRPIAPSCVADGSPGAGHTPCLPRLSVWAPGYAARVPVSSGAIPRACQDHASESPSRADGDQAPVGAGLQPGAPCQEVRWGPCLDVAPDGSWSPVQHTALLALADPLPIRQRVLDRCRGVYGGCQALRGRCRELPVFHILSCEAVSATMTLESSPLGKPSVA